jgi:hypothetical protein
MWLRSANRMIDCRAGCGPVCCVSDCRVARIGESVDPRAASGVDYRYRRKGVAKSLVGGRRRRSVARRVRGQ